MLVCVILAKVAVLLKLFSLICLVSMFILPLLYFVRVKWSV